MKSSIDAVEKSLPENQRKDFEDALQVLALADVHDLNDIVALGSDKTGKLERGMKERLNGKTGEEIIAAAKQVTAGEEGRKKQEAINEIEALWVKLAAQKPDVLAKFVIEHSRLGKNEFNYYVDLAVRNNTGFAMSGVYCRAILLTPGRAVPWVDDSFDYSIPGGLESGEAAAWQLNMFGSKWDATPKDRDDLILIVRPVRLDGPNGKPLTGEVFDDNDAQRLRSLVNSIQYEKATEINAALDARDKTFAQWQASAVPAMAKSETDQLRKRKADADAAKTSLAKFVVEGARFYWIEGAISSLPVIELTVHNRTGKVVSQFYSHGVLSSPGREMPWVDGDFDYTVAGGLQPGESQQIKIPLFGAWGEAPKDRTDTVLTVTVKRLDGADGKELFPSDFADADAKRLAALEKMTADNKWK